MFPTIDRVYVNAAGARRARLAAALRFPHVLDCLARGEDFRSPLARAIGSKGYHDTEFADGPYPVA